MSHPVAIPMVLVTGGTGFIGTYVVEELRRRGLNCRVLAREHRRVPLRVEGAAEEVIGDILNQECVDECLSGVSHVIHLAAAVGGWERVPGHFLEVNVAGTRNVLLASLRRGVEAFVHVSSGSAIDFVGAGIRDERSIGPRLRNQTEYGRSKALAEEEVDRAAREGLHATIVYPTRVFGIGPLDDSNAATKAIDAYLRGRLPVLPGGGKSMANWGYVNDIASGIVQALFRGSGGGRYILGGENARLCDVFAMARSYSGRHPVSIPLPHAMGRAAATLEELRARLFRSQPLITRAWYDAVFEDTQLSCGLAFSEIGYTVTPLARALQAVVTWLSRSATAAEEVRSDEK